VTPSTVAAVAPARPAEAAAHFAARLRFETDCADVHRDLAAGVAGFVVVDARSPSAYAAGHVPGARSLPHAAIAPETTHDLPRDALVVTYCAGPHCNGATRAAAALARLGYSVKEMIGGMAGWRAEGFAVAGGEPDRAPRSWKTPPSATV
jgi:rhodanese-related sulfurtransferase